VTKRNEALAPAPEQWLFDASATELAALVRARELSSVELVDLHISRIEAVNPKLNAVVAERFDEARREARAADEAAARGEALPLHGVPCTIKDFIGVAGLPQTGGLLSRRSTRAVADAEIVRRLKRAGAIVLGTTNVPEGGLCVETSNRVYGRTNNPWDSRRTSGGSSGGEGAIVAAGGVPFGLGTDTGGSIRIPAAFCGVVGHKPTGRLVPNTGIWPQLRGARSGYHCAGPLARRVADLMPILRVLAGPDESDEVVQSWQLGDPDAVDLKDVVVYPVPTHPTVRIHPAVQRAVRDSAEALAARGARIADLSPSRLRYAFAIWSAMMSRAEGGSYQEILGDGTAIDLVDELVHFVRGRSQYTFPALSIAVVEALLGWTVRVGNWVDAGLKMRAVLEEELGPSGVLLHPPYSSPAPRHNEPLLRPFDFVCTGLFNVLEFPSTVVPVGFDAGLPVAVQVIGRRGNDHLTIAAAAALEDAFGGWVRAEP
jgi:fatty acid amide hydrolase 2